MSPIKYFVLKEELFKREISLTSFARELGVPTPVLSGKGSPFPLERLDRAIDLLNNWPGPTKKRKSRQSWANKLEPVRREMLLAVQGDK